MTAATLAPNALTTFQTALDELGISSPGGAESNRIIRYINRASQQIEQHVGRPLFRATITEDLPGESTVNLVIRRPPIESITTIKINGALVDALDFESLGIDIDAGIIHNVGVSWPFTGRRRSGAAPDIQPGTERRLIEVVYVGGVVTPEQLRVDQLLDNPVLSTKRLLPPDIEQACLMLITSLFRSQGQDPRIKTIKIGDASDTYFGAEGRSGIPMAARDLLAPHRRIAFAA